MAERDRLRHRLDEGLAALGQDLPAALRERLIDYVELLARWNAAYNLTMFHWLTVDSEAGKFLAGIFGWDPRPSVEQVAVYLLYLVPALVAFFWGANRPVTPRGAADPERPAEPARA